MLLDTHVVLWLLDDSPRLGVRARELILQSAATVSVASLWELAIKSALGKVRVPDDFPQQVENSGLTLLDVTPAHAWAVGTDRGLPHRDPFDAMLVAQAALERWPLMTADEQLLRAASALSIELVDARE